MTDENRSDNQTPWWVKVFGGAVIIILFSTAAGAIQQCFYNITIISNRVESLVKKEDFEARLTAQWEVVKDLQADRTKVNVLEERTKSQDEKIKKLEFDIEAAKDEINKLKERMLLIEKDKSASTPTNSNTKSNT